MKYIAKRFDSIYYLAEFLNDNEIPRQDIVKIVLNKSGCVDLLYIIEREDE